MSLPLSEFHIERFRGIRGLDLSGLGQFNLLVGRNNAGKTSVLEALSIFSSPLDPWVWLYSIARREFLSGSDQLEGLRWLFPSGVEHLVQLEGQGAYPIRRVFANHAMVLGSSGKPAEASKRGVSVNVSVEAASSKDPSPGALDKLWNAFTLWEGETFQLPERQYEPALPMRVIAPYTHWIQDLPVRGFSEAKLGGFEKDVIGLVQSIEPGVTGAEVIATSSRPQLYLRDERAGLLPLSTFGDGIRRAFLLALSIPPAAGGFLLIDELETAIHVSALERVFRWLLDACAKYRVQVFATTHSLEALDAILAVDTTPEEDIVAYRLEREDDRTTARRYGEDLLKRVRYERGLDVR
jgi:hypothetical protein